MVRLKAKPVQQVRRPTRSEKLAGMVPRQPGETLARLRDELVRGVTYEWWRDSSVFQWALMLMQLQTGRPLPVIHDNRADLPPTWMGEVLGRVRGGSLAELSALAYRADDLGRYAQCAVAALSFNTMWTTALPTARTYLARGEQLDAFHGVVPPEEPLRLPFSTVYIEFEEPRDLLPAEDHEIGGKRELVFGVLVNLDTAPTGGQLLTLVLLAPNQFSVTVRASKEELNFQSLVEHPVEAIEPGREVHPHVRVADEEIFNFLYLLQAKNVRLEATSAPKAVNAQRRKRGQTPLDDVHRVVFIDQPRRPAGGTTGTGRTVGYRFDVAGHWRTYNRGTPEAFSKWIPAHQRGLANEVYKPRTRAMRHNYEAEELT